MADILIVEDEESINQLIKQNLMLSGHRCTQIFDGGEARRHLLKKPSYDVIIMDIMLPGVNGLELMKDTGDNPVIFLTAKDGLADKIAGLTSGAWDYLTKPFEMLELLARVNLILQKTKKEENILQIGKTRINLCARSAFLADREVELTPQEFELLEVLVRNRNIALSREQLLELAWGMDYMGDTRTVDVHINKLRKKLDFEDVIKTVYKMGYRLEV